MSRVHNKPLIALWLAGAAAVMLTGFVSHAPNRLLSGSPLRLWEVADAGELTSMALLAAALLGAAFVPSRRSVHALVAIAAGLLIVLALDAAGTAATKLLSAARPAARTSLAAAFWIVTLCLGLITADAVQRLKMRPLGRLIATSLAAGAVVAVAATHRLDDLSIAREYASHREAFAAELARHALLVLATVVPALAIGAPLGVAVARRRALRQTVFAVLNILQTIPSIAVFGLLILPLSALAAKLPALAAFGIQGIGAAPAILALVLYALLPIVRNTEAGIAGVDAGVVAAATGMGLTPRQVLWSVELPLGLPVFLAGVRIVLVQTIGLAAVAALIGAGGLGAFMFQGIGQYAVDLVLLGAVPTIALALAADMLMRLAIDAATVRRPPA